MMLSDPEQNAAPAPHQGPYVVATDCHVTIVAVMTKITASSSIKVHPDRFTLESFTV
jgi:hypothetical protein